MEDDIDIYEDLPSFGNENDGNFTSNKESIDEQPQLKKKIEELTEKVENLQKINESLEKNLFSLLKTAKAEILRKDRMIDELKKQLDDMTFKRRMCHKNGNNTTYKTTLRETAVNTNHKLTNGYIPPSQNIVEADVKDSYCNQVKDESNNKCSLIPLTVFGERVAKRIADEQNSENKDNVKRFNNKNNDNNENTEGYTIESDKENGSLTDTNIPTSTEINSLVSTIYKEDKCAKSSLVASKLDTGIDIESNNKSEISSKPEEKSIPNTNCIGKRTRTNDEINRYDSKKRIKLSEEDNVTKKINTEVKTNIENNIHTTEGRYSFKNSDTRHTRTWNRRPIEDNKNDERKDLKHRSCALRDDRDTSRKHRDNNISKRDGYRYNHNGYYRTKSRERDRFDNYHRERSVSSHREERYVRKQHTKYTNHEDKFQKRHNFHNNNVDKLKHFKEEEDSSNIHSMTKGFTSERNSTDWKIIEMKRDYHNNDYELWKVRSKSIDKPNKYKAKSTRDIIECLEHLESTNRTTEKDDIIVEQIESAIKKEDTERNG